MTRKTCSAERLQKVLEAYGVKAGISRIRKIRRKLGIRCIKKRKFKATIDSSHSFPVANNLLNQEFSVSAPNKVWTSDITYVDTEEGWLYLAEHKNLFHNELVG